jgi:hypothetical protein
VLDVSASNTDGFLSRDTCVPSSQLNRPILNKEILSSPVITSFPESIPLNDYINSHRETMS